MDVKLPPLGEGADSGTVVNLFVKEGDRIAKDQPLLELENEKAVATIPASAGGVVRKIYVKPGDKLGVGQKILSVESDAQASDGPATSASRPEPRPAETKSAQTESEPAEAHAREEESAPAETAEEPTPVGDQPEPGMLVAASPTIRKLARDLGIDLARVRGTARGGRIVLSDVRAYIQRLQKMATQPKATPAPAAAVQPPAGRIDFSKWGSVTRQKLSPLREVIARRMWENWNAIPHVTQFDEVDISDLLALRKKYLEAYERAGARLTVTPFIIKALVDTLKQHPIFNASLDEATQDIVLKQYYHIGIAVDTEAGLIVPVMRDADRKSLLDLSKELEELAARARDRKVSADELKGGTFTISNQGGIGGAHFTPIVNRPEVAILGLGRGALKSVVREKKVEIRTMLPLALSYDHRVIDGGAAARFIVDLVRAVEEFPERDVALPS